MKAIKIGVVGTGNMGRNHVRILSNEKNVFELVAIYDKAVEQAEKLSKMYNVNASSDFSKLLTEVDAVVIAVPSSLHLEFGLLAAEKGVHALIEKPLATSGKDAARLCEAFGKADKKLMVGYVERFNPVVLEMKKLIANEMIYAIEARRYSNFDGRITDANVVFDLMIHDIDIICNFLCKENIKRLQSVSSSVKTNLIDFAECIIKFENDVIASITASRVTNDKVRELIVHASGSYIKADLLNKTIHVTKNADLLTSFPPNSSYRLESISQRIFVPIVEPLVSELLHFGNCINEDTVPFTDGNSALYAIKIAEDITYNSDITEQTL